MYINLKEEDKIKVEQALYQRLKEDMEGVKIVSENQCNILIRNIKRLICRRPDKVEISNVEHKFNDIKEIINRKLIVGEIVGEINGYCISKRRVKFDCGMEYWSYMDRYNVCKLYNDDEIIDMIDEFIDKGKYKLSVSGRIKSMSLCEYKQMLSSIENNLDGIDFDKIKN